MMRVCFFVAVGLFGGLSARASFDIFCAADDSPMPLKSAAKYVCPAGDARETLQKAINEAAELGVRCVLAKGTYVIDSRGTLSPRGGLYFPNFSKAEKIYAHQAAHFNILEGATMPLGFRNGAVIVMGRKLYEDIRDDETFSFFYCVYNSIFGRAWKLKNLVIRLPDNQKPIVVVDGRFSMALEYENLWVCGFDPQTVDYASAAGVSVPHSRSVGIRGTAGSNFYAMTTWKNLVVQGFGTGFDIGGEHVYCESLSALYNIYGFAFDCYCGKSSINSPDARPVGGSFYPIVCVNLLDEHNVNMPRFGHASHGNGKSAVPEYEYQSVTIRGMNIQWPNTCPGRTNMLDAAFLTGRHRATEVQPGSWRGSVEYVIDPGTPQHNVRMSHDPFFEKGHGTGVRARNLLDVDRGGSLGMNEKGEK